MSGLSSWVDQRIENALNAVLPTVVPLVVSEVTKSVVGALEELIGGIPPLTTSLVSTELQQLPQQVQEVLNIPAEVEGAVTNGLSTLPTTFTAILGSWWKSVIPFGGLEK